MSTLATFRSHISAVIGTDPTAGQADELLVDAFCNEAILKILAETHCYVTSTTVTPGATKDYTFPASTIAIVDMYFTSGGADYPSLEPVSVDEMLRLRRVTGSSPSSKFAVPSQNLIMFWPTPGASDTLTMYYVPTPTAMSTGTNDPSNATYGGIPSEWHELIEWYAMFRMADYDDDSSSQSGERYRKLYQEGIQNFKKALRVRGGQRLSPARVNRRRRNAFTRPDTEGV